MAESFDPYEQWLGIAPSEHPVDHYRMLGVPRFERDLRKIANAADERMNTVRSYQTGRRGQYTQRILNELSSAKICLLSPGSKATYDAVLEGQLAAAQNKASSTMPQNSSFMPPSANMPQPSGWSNSSPPIVTPPMSPPVMPPNQPFSEPYPQFAPASPVAPPPFPASANSPKQVRSPSTPAPTPPANDGNEANEEQASLMARPWFPVAVLGIVGVLVGGAVLVRSWRNRPSPTVTHVMDAPPPTPPAPTQQAPTETPSKTPPRRTTEVLLSQEGDGGVNFPPQMAVIHGQKADLQTRNEEYVIGNWTSSEVTLTWRFHLVKPQHFRAQITYSAAEDAAGGRFAIVVDGDEKQADVRPSEPPGTFQTDEFFVSVKRAGNHHLTLRAVNKPGAELMTFKSLRLTPYNAGREKPKAE